MNTAMQCWSASGPSSFYLYSVWQRVRTLLSFSAEQCQQNTEWALFLRPSLPKRLCDVTLWTWAMFELMLSFSQSTWAVFEDISETNAAVWIHLFLVIKYLYSKDHAISIHPETVELSILPDTSFPMSLPLLSLSRWMLLTLWWPSRFSVACNISQSLPELTPPFTRTLKCTKHLFSLSWFSK